MSIVIESIARHAKTRASAPALVSSESTLTYGQLREQADSFAATLERQLSNNPGCVAIALENSVVWVLVDLALTSLKRASLPLPSFFTPDQLWHALDSSGAGWLVAANEPGIPLQCAGETIYLRELNGDKARLPAGTAKVTYTSGSTGASKGVCLQQNQIEAVSCAIVERVGASFAGVHMPLLPLAVLLENVAGLYPILIAGGCYWIERPSPLGLGNPFKPDFAALGAALIAGKATSLILVPELLRGMLAAKCAGRMEWPALNFVAVGGAKVAPDLIAAARAHGMPVFEGYGLTECASVVAVNTPVENRPGSVGKPFSHLEVRIEADREIVVASSGEDVCTGDLGHFDQDGFLYVTGRKSNLIITSFGRNISPEWVESELQAEPQVRHAIVYGEAQPELGALIVPTLQGLTRADVGHAIARANSRLPAYAHIAHFEIIEPLSDRGFLTGNGRPMRAAILAAHRHLLDIPENA